MTDEAAMPPAGAGPHRVPSTAGGPVLALDLGGTRVRAAAVAADGRVLHRLSRDTPISDGPGAVLDLCLELLHACRAHLADRHGERPVGLGISAPGPLDPTSGRLIDPPNLGPAFHDLPLAPPLERALALPAFLERDTHVAALAEGAFGAARGIDDYLYLTVSTGIGGAIVTGGRLLTGPDGVAGELGHLLVELDGPVCGCGGRGHLEALSSGTGIARAAAEALSGDADSTLRQIAARLAPAPIQAVHVAVAEEAGDALAGTIMERARRAFAEAMVGMVDVFNPERIIVGGGIAMNQGERWLGPAREAVARSSFRVAARRVSIVPPDLGEDVGLAGAIPLVAAGMAAPAAGLASRSAAAPGDVAASGPASGPGSGLIRGAGPSARSAALASAAGA